VIEHTVWGGPFQKKSLNIFWVEVPRAELARMTHLVRDARLELTRLHWEELTDPQRETMHEMERRLDATARDMLSPEPLPRKAMEALAAFGWPAP